jgi:hypothetical protein
MKTKILSTVKMKRILSYLPFIFILLIAGCIKTEDRCPTYRLPNATQTGQNTVGCLIDDVVMVPKRGDGGGFIIVETKEFSYNQETGELNLRVNFLANEKDYECGYPRRLLVLSAENVFIEGKIDPDNYYSRIDIHPEFLGRLQIYRYDRRMNDISSNIVITKLDTIANIISGSFNFEAFRGIHEDYDPDDILLITEGRFDFNYRQDGGYIRGFSNED